MPTHNSVPTTCTASLITDWNIPNLKSDDPKVQVNVRLNTVNQLIGRGYFEDFALLFAITTHTQNQDGRLTEFLGEGIGFTNAFTGSKADNTKKQRHQETGDLTMWCIKPADFKEGLQRYKKELEAIKEEIDPPKKPDPARQKFPDLKLSHLRKAGIVQDNASVRNGLHAILLVSPEKAYLYIKMNFGIDVKLWRNAGDNWTKMTGQSLKDAQVAWKNELV